MGLAHGVQLLITRLKVAGKYKYFGIILGAKTTEEAYGLTLGKATGRAFSMHLWPLSPTQRVELLESGRLPLLVYLGRVVSLDENAISAVETIYHMAVKLEGRGVISHMLSHPKEHGGMDLAPPRTFMLLQSSTLFVRHVHKTEVVLLFVTAPYELFSKNHGGTLSTMLLFGCLAVLGTHTLG